ncbi:methylmalonyl-CoA mutase subunit beta [Maribacter cobaltidurans]|uniref:Methylmalonyl-CoA mutase n=1 Tax=Maribacter cobaltidurans TaxID=1178778 RepID=A0A223V3E1_9FLAO|nr:methylmalonyl-CoA mutase subunit beta [Maribacter cobaltidurans]ASV29901.1 methylmalonyl-CoA mutase [Maribacter cobaltidurans]GGD88814.1 methylmalonyl-CoA mutase [Maribacter cobaltidurans]
MSKKKAELLFEEFPPVSAKAWKQKIQYDLKGADYNEELVWKSREGIHVKPFYHREDLGDICLSIDSEKTWKIGQSIYAGVPEKANKRALKFLERGVETLHFSVPNEEVQFKALLKDIDLQQIPVSFHFSFLSVSYIESLLNYAEKGCSNFFLNIDIIGNLARTGNWFHNLTKDHEILERLLKTEADNLLSVDTTLYENAGADIVQQLGYGLAHANEYVQHLYDKGVLDGMEKFTFKVATGGNYFFEIAKLRALRLLWCTLMEEYGLNIDCHIVAEPSRRNKTVYDYNMNMVRTTTECMSAILGGAHVVFNQPYDRLYHKDNAFSSRIALNQLLIFKEEAYLDKVQNAADGAYYIESLTRQLAEKALILFKSVEKEGGFLKQLKGGIVQQNIREAANRQQEQFNKGTEVLVGTNKFLNGSDRMKDDLELYPFVKKRPRKTLVEPIIESRLAEAIEQKRLNDE